MAGRKKNYKKKKTKKTTKKKQMLISKKFAFVIGALILLSLILIGITFSYAFWIYNDSQSGANSVSAGCLSFSFNDRDVDGNVTSINLENAYPMSDTKGMTLNPYIFTVTNTCTLDANVYIYLHKLATSTMDSQYMKVSLLDNNNSINYGPVLISNINNGVLSDDINNTVKEKVGNVDSTYLLNNFMLKQDESITLNMRMWIDYDAPNEVMGLTYDSAVSVFATTLE